MDDVPPKIENLPEPGEIIIGRIFKVLDYGVFMELLEYEGLQGFVHISNVSSSWIKNIRNFVKEGQIRAGKVINIDRSKRQVDISLTKVSANAQREKIEEYKQGKRSQKLVELLAQKLGEPAPVGPAGQAFRVAVRRVSFSAGRLEKLHAYYVLTELGD